MRTRPLLLVLAAALVVAACGPARADRSLTRAEALDPAIVPVPSTVVTTTSTTSTTSTTTTSTTTTTTTTAPPPPPTAAPSDGLPPPAQRPAVRTVTTNDHTPMATFADVVVHHPAAAIELIGWHESGHDGARQLEPADSAVTNVTMESRERGTGSRTAADIAVDPTIEIRSPVTGTVARAGSYTLYCDHTDEFIVINPDSAPSWELKVLHVVGRTVSAGDRVEAGVTVIAERSRVLPFESQIDEYTAEPSWPHVHIELVDPSIPDRPSGGGCS